MFRSEMLNTNRLAESVSQAFCMALIDYLDQLYESGLTKISLRISLDIDKANFCHKQATISFLTFRFIL